MWSEERDNYRGDPWVMVYWRCMYENILLFQLKIEMQANYGYSAFQALKLRTARATATHCRKVSDNDSNYDACYF
jgi:hypothetical protein